MCGVVAIFSRGGPPVSRGALDRAVAALAHRGPDGAGCWVSPSGRVGLGHTRLSIVDLEGGAQPIANEDETIHAVVNGELYDDERARARLTAGGHRFRTRSDSEIALHLYEDLGPGFVTGLRGEFAVLLWDEREQALLATRDRFGIKPLYYAVHGGAVVLASEIKALAAAGIPLRWNARAFARFGALQTCAQHETFFDGIHQVPPGHTLLCRRGGLELVRYWDLELPPRRPVAPPSPEDDERAAAALREVLDEAVRLRLRADVPVACYLSGGLDSSGALALASRHAHRPIDTFTITFDQPEYDEGGEACEVARRLGASHHPVAVTAGDLADRFADAVWHGETLFANLHGVAKFLLSAAVREAGYKVVLTGEGADEVFAGYSGFVRDVLLHNPEGQVEADVARLRRRIERDERLGATLSLGGASRVLDAVTRTLGFLPGWLHERAGTAACFETVLAPDLRETLDRDDLADDLRAVLDPGGKLEGRDPLNQSMYAWAKTFLPSYILAVLGDRMEMAHSVEGRVPYLDHHVVELAAALPVAQKVRGGTEKFLLRAALRPLVPDAVYRRPKHPFAAPPLASSGNRRLAELMNDLLRGSTLGALPFIDHRRVVALLDGLDGLESHARVELEPVLLGLLSACVLHRRLGVT